jgi:hypothetical protein
VRSKLHSSNGCRMYPARRALRHNYRRRSCCPGKGSLSEERNHEELALCVLGTYGVVVVVVRHDGGLFDGFDWVVEFCVCLD